MLAWLLWNSGYWTKRRAPPNLQQTVDEATRRLFEFLLLKLPTKSLLILLILHVLHKITSGSCLVTGVTRLLISQLPCKGRSRAISFINWQLSSLFWGYTPQILLLTGLPASFLVTAQASVSSHELSR